MSRERNWTNCCVFEQKNEGVLSGKEVEIVLALFNL